MRICLYTETALPKIGGQEMVVDALARQFVELGQDVVVLAPQPRLPLRAKDGDLPYPVVRHPRFYSTRFLVSWYRWWLLRLHRRFRFQVLHCQGLYQTGYMASLLRDRLGVPTVITSHGGDVSASNGRLARPVLRPRYVQALQKADVLVAISRFTANGYRRLWPQAQRIVHIPNGVDLEPFQQPAARPADLDQAIRPGEYFLFLGRLKRRKGVDLILKALTGIPPSGGVQLVVAGDGEERPALEAQATQLGLMDRVRFVGGAFGAKKTYLLQNALTTIMPSRISEAFGLVVLESYAAGTPVIVTRLPGLEDLVQEGQTGWLVHAEATADLTRAMRSCLGERERARRMGQEGQDRVTAYSWSAVARQYLDLYEGLLAAPMAARGA